MSESAFDDSSWRGEASSSSHPLYLPLIGGTVAVYLDDEFMMYLDGEEALEAFDLFLRSGLLSNISDANHQSGVGVDYPLWLKIQGVLQVLDDSRQEHHDLAAGAPTEYYYEATYSYDDHTSADNPADVLSAGRFALDDDAILRPNHAEEEFPAEPAALVDNDGGEDSMSLSPSSETSQSPGTHVSHSDLFFYDDTVGEILREQAIGNGVKPLAVLQVRVAEAEQTELLPPPPQSSSSVGPGNVAPDELKKIETQQQPQADSVVSTSLSPPGLAIV